MKSRCCAQRYIDTGAIGQYRHRAAIFHWKTLGAGSEFANSLTVEGNFGVPATRRATNNMAVVSTSGRNLSIKYPTIALSQRYTAIPLYEVYEYTTASYSNGTMFTSLLRLRRLTMNVRSGAFYTSRAGGGGGKGGVTSDFFKSETICAF